MRFVFFQIIAVTASLIAALPGRAGDNSLPKQAYRILTEYCAECHLATGDGGFDYVNDLVKLVAVGKVVPGNPDASRIVRLLKALDVESRMPKSYASKPNVPLADIELIEAWIEAGAKPYATDPKGVEADRSAVSNLRVFRAIHLHLKKLPAEDRSFQRYFTLHHLHNLPGSEFSTGQLRNLRAATSKVLNSLSWRSEMVLPKSVDEAGTVLVFDLRDLDWDASHSADKVDLWQHLLDGYPYGLAFDQTASDLELKVVAREVYQMTGTKLPFVRADWFVANASRPPHYHELLYDLVLPKIFERSKVEVDDPDGGKLTEFAMTAKDLESFLRVDVVGNIRRHRAARAAFAKSNVSTGARMVERHSAIFGYYWKTADFARRDSLNDVLRKPIGPPGALNIFEAEKFAYQHSGGEVVFSLPNHLQGFLLVNGKDERLAFGPPSLVSDASRALGNAQIVNGISCMYCHTKGIVRGFEDEVRFGQQGLPPDIRNAMLRLYREPSELNALLDKDEKAYMVAVSEATSPYLLEIDKVGGLLEPIKPVAQRYYTKDMGLLEIAVELDIEVAKLKPLIEQDRKLSKELGLAIVAGGGRIKRASWEAGAINSSFQSTAAHLKLGEPVRISIR